MPPDANVRRHASVRTRHCTRTARLLGEARKLQLFCDFGVVDRLTADAAFARGPIAIAWHSDHAHVGGVRAWRRGAITSRAQPARGRHGRARAVSRPESDDLPLAGHSFQVIPFVEACL